MTDFKKIRADFPILSRQVHEKPMVFLDSAATTQKPKAVIESLKKYYEYTNANVHRGAYVLSQEATDQYEGVRDKVARLIGAQKTKEIIYTSGTTEGINLVAQCWGQLNVKEGDDVIVTRMEHHSNFVPWQNLARQKKANFKIVELDKDFRLDLESLKDALSGKPKVLAISLQSNVLGTVNPISEIAQMAKERGAIVVVDGAQGVANLPVSLSKLGPIDFLAFSSHKMCGPTGAGILWGREELLNKMQPYQYGGDMILKVGDQESLWNELPWKFEAGTPHIGGIIGLGAAVDYLMDIGMDQIETYEQEITDYALKKLAELEFVKIFGPQTAENRGSAISMEIGTIHPHDIATYLDAQGIAVRAGHHCAQPLIQKNNVSATVRASFYFYNQKDEVDSLVEHLKGAHQFFA